MPINDLKPNASQKTRVSLAALLWSCIGLMLIGRGGISLAGTGHEWLVVVSLLVGTGKSWLILDKVVVKNMMRIYEKGEYSCLGGIYSWKTWLLVAAMIIMGKLLRMSPLPAWLIGSLYVAVGWSLLWSSRKSWARFRELPGKSPGEANKE